MAQLECRTPMSVAALVGLLHGPAQIIGDPARTIRCIAPLENATPGSLSFSKTADEFAKKTSAMPDGAVVVVPESESPAQPTDGLTLISVAQPRAYFIRAVNLLTGGEAWPSPGISASALVADSAVLGDKVFIGPGAYVGHNAAIGNGSVIFGGTQIYEDVWIGAGCIVQANAALGVHGQAFVRDDDGAIIPMPHLGRVIIGDRVRIGANASVVRGTLRDTVIDADTSIGNGANIGHNVTIGARCFIGPGALLAGSSTVGNDTWVSIGAIVRGVHVGANATVGAGAVVTRPVADGQTVNGFPARVTGVRD